MTKFEVKVNWIPYIDDYHVFIVKNIRYVSHIIHNGDYFHFTVDGKHICRESSQEIELIYNKLMELIDSISD